MTSSKESVFPGPMEKVGTFFASFASFGSIIVPRNIFHSSIILFEWQILIVMHYTDIVRAMCFDRTVSDSIPLWFDWMMLNYTIEADNVHRG